MPKSSKGQTTYNYYSGYNETRVVYNNQIIASSRYNSTSPYIIGGAATKRTTYTYKPNQYNNYTMTVNVTISYIYEITKTTIGNSYITIWYF